MVIQREVTFAKNLRSELYKETGENLFHRLLVYVPSLGVWELLKNLRSELWKRGLGIGPGKAILERGKLHGECREDQTGFSEKR